MENQSTELCVCIVHCVPTFHWAGRICCGCSRSSPDQRSSSPLELFSPENSSLFNIHTMPQNIQDLFKPLDISTLTSFGNRNTFTAHTWPQHKTTPKRNMSRHGMASARDHLPVWPAVHLMTPRRMGHAGGVWRCTCS